MKTKSWETDLIHVKSISRSFDLIFLFLKYINYASCPFNSLHLLKRHVGNFWYPSIWLEFTFASAPPLKGSFIFQEASFLGKSLNLLHFLLVTSEAFFSRVLTICVSGLGVYFAIYLILLGELGHPLFFPSHILRGF